MICVLSADVHPDKPGSIGQNETISESSMHWYGARDQDKIVEQPGIVTEAGHPLYKCNMCEMEFMKIDCWRNHMRAHAGTDRLPLYTTPRNRQFTRLSSINCQAQQHADVIKHPGQRRRMQWICNVCSMTCSSIGELQNHQLICKDSNPSIRKRSSNAVQPKKRHMPLICGICSMKFSALDDLQNHRLICKDSNPSVHKRRHNKVQLKTRLRRRGCICKPHKCSKCANSFDSSNQLTSHLKSHEDEDKHFGCGSCGSVFLHAESARDHYFEQHAEINIMD